MRPLSSPLAPRTKLLLLPASALFSPRIALSIAQRHDSNPQTRVGHEISTVEVELARTS